MDEDEALEQFREVCVQAAAQLERHLVGLIGKEHAQTALEVLGHSIVEHARALELLAASPRPPAADGDQVIADHLTDQLLARIRAR
jgi:hypothetical protein